MIELGKIKNRLAQQLVSAEWCDCITLTVLDEHLLLVCKTLRDEFQCDQLMDVCGVDYQEYGKSHWRTHETTESGFSRGVADAVTETKYTAIEKPPARFASVYHLLSTQHNQRIRIKVFVSDNMIVPSLIDIWK